MNNSILGVVIIGTLILTTPAEAVITFERTYGGTDGDWGTSVQETQDGGYIIAGLTWSFGTGWSNVYLIKTDAAGDTVWTKTYDGANHDCYYGYSVQETQDGGYIIAGTTESFGAVEEDVYLIKTDAAGDTVWTKTYGGVKEEYGNSVQETQDGGYIIAGTTESFGAGSCDVYLIKTDASGDTVWTKTYGGANYDRGNSVQETQDGGYIIAGSTESFGAGSADVYLIKTDAAGDTVWSKTYGGTDGDAGYFVQSTQDGGYIIAGWTTSFGAGWFDVYLIKTNSVGNTVWTRTYGGTKLDIGYSVQETQDGGYIIVGETDTYISNSYKDVWLIKTDSVGDTVWTKIYGDEIYYDGGYSVQETQDGGYIIAGFTESFGAGYSDVWLIKTDSEGNTGVGIEEGEGLPITAILHPPLPNPFSSNLSITYILPEPSQVELSVYDLAGRLINTLEDGSVSTGGHTTVWNPDPSIPVGCYMIVLDADGDRSVRRCVKLE